MFATAKQLRANAASRELWARRSYGVEPHWQTARSILAITGVPRARGRDLPAAEGWRNGKKTRRAKPNSQAHRCDIEDDPERRFATVD
jgi:hypothetical protein